MKRDLLRSVTSLPAEKQALADGEKRLIRDLNRVPPAVRDRIAPLAKAAGVA